MRGRNDEKGRCLKFVSPAKAGVQPKVFKRASLQFEDVYPIMDSSVRMEDLNFFFDYLVIYGSMMATKWALRTFGSSIKLSSDDF